MDGETQSLEGLAGQFIQREVGEMPDEFDVPCPTCHADNAAPCFLRGAPSTAFSHAGRLRRVRMLRNAIQADAQAWAENQVFGLHRVTDRHVRLLDRWAR